MKFKFICFIFLLISKWSYAQRDSSLMKFVKQIRAGIEERNEDEKRKHPFAISSIKGHNRMVLIDSTFVQIDSLYKYNIQDFGSITIELHWPEKVYGSSFRYGLIILDRKKEELH